MFSMSTCHASTWHVKIDRATSSCIHINVSPFRSASMLNVNAACQVWKWTWNVNVECPDGISMLNVKVECQRWTPMLNVNVECQWSMSRLSDNFECQRWVSKLNTKFECHRWMPMLNVDAECKRLMPVAQALGSAVRAVAQAPGETFLLLQIAGRAVSVIMLCLLFHSAE